jgi:hypothetical protein
MLRNIDMINDQEDAKSSLNSSDPHINRGFELMLRQYNKEEKPSKPKTFQIAFGKMISLLRREIHFHFEISFNILKK